ncbi:unnamed protein product, partial [Brenthis ino]
MEAVEEHPVISSNIDIVKPNVIEGANVETLEPPVCHKSNGVDCDQNTESGHSEANDDVAASNVNEIICDKPDIIEILPENNETNVVEECVVSVDSEVIKDGKLENETKGIEQEVQETESIEISSNVVEIEKEVVNEHEIITETVEIDSIETIESAMSIEQVTFETEIVVEKNDNDCHESLVIEEQINDSNNILSELGQNIELSEVLRASDVSENNNSTVKQEVFNKEELLDILEGNDDNEHSVEQVIEISKVSQTKAEIALQQLSRLKSTKKKKNPTPKGKKNDKKNNANADLSKCESHGISENKLLNSNKQESNSESKEGSISESKTESGSKQETTSDSKLQKEQSDSIVNKLVMDWEDDEPGDNKCDQSIEECDHELKDSENLKEMQENSLNAEPGERTSVDSTLSEEHLQKANKSGDEGAPRRLGRVIKKKVIFDPDNPDTFTKGKTITKTKENLINKEQTPSKKIKPEQVSQRSKSKSPLSKLQWKKPTPKNNKQNKRLTEVDKLLMDEGAVNMIYQLTPEATKGKKNMKTKAEFIKKLQSSTPEGKEMKFRERKKESIKYEDGEAKKILSGKQRNSLSSSVKSPSVCEDFETHSADDSIIYRRHSSSSYSSSCMSPRRLSDVESGYAQNVTKPSNQRISSDNHNESRSTDIVEDVEHSAKDVFKTELTNTSSDIINKDDCLSIKEKLNSKLSLALNKRKRESSKIDKPAKHKKLLKPGDQENINTSVQMKDDQFKFISVNVNKRLAIICIQKTGLKICVEVLKELQEALNYIDSIQDISITLFTSQCGTLCSSLDLSLLLDENKVIRTNYAYELAESVRSLLSAVVRHSKLVCVGAWGACAGVALALVALSDVALACEGATFSLAAAGAPPLPGAAALTARCRALPQALVNDLVVFGRRLSAAEALSGGLVSRVLWPDRFDDQVASIARDIASQPAQVSILYKLYDLDFT